MPCMKTLTLRHSGAQVTVELDDVVLFSSRPWGTILHFGIAPPDDGMEAIEVREPREAIMAEHHARREAGKQWDAKFNAMLADNDDDDLSPSEDAAGGTTLANVVVNKSVDT